ncbi:MAG: hypothetical protein ACM3UW_05330 [Bacillota bacterium]
MRKITLLFLMITILLCPSTRPLWAVTDDHQITAVFSHPLPYDEWYEADKAYLAELISCSKGNPRALTIKLVREWQMISVELGNALKNCYLEPTRQYYVYNENTSGRIHVLGLAKYHRERLLTDLLSGTFPSRPYPNRWSGNNPTGIPAVSSLGFSPTVKPVQYGINEVCSVINDLGLPRSTFRGVSFYILPFDITGYAASSHSKYLPGRDESIYLSASVNNGSHPLAATITHELGHYIHSQYIGTYEQNQVKWKSFMNLVGQERFNNHNSQFQDRTYEIFAEYFRMVYGSNRSRLGMKYLCSAPNPIYNVSLFNGFRQIVDDLVGSPDPSYYDVNHMQVSGIDCMGQPFSLPVGVRSEQINTIVTTSPDLNFSSRVMLNPEDPFNPLLACFRFDPKAVLVDHSTPKVEQGHISCNIRLPRPGIYTLFVGETDGSRNILNPMSFKIIYTGNL